MNRRGFFGTLAGVVAGSLAAATAKTVNWYRERVTDRKTGISMRYVRGYDIVTDQMPRKLDVFYAMPEIDNDNGLNG